MAIHKVQLQANGLQFTASSSWPQASLGKRTPERLILLLHGFPDNRRTWHEMIVALEKAFPDALIVAPSMRGYEPSTVLPDSNYTQVDIASDNASFIQQLSLGAPAHVVGHDWGAVNAYALASLHPELLTSVVTLAIPYCTIGRALPTMLKHPKQLWLSSYMLTMQFPFIYRPRIAQAVPYIPYIKNLWEYWSPTWQIPDEVLQDVCDTLHQPGVADASTAYYRCLAQSIRKRQKFAVDFDKIPFLILGGANDGCMAAELFEEDKAVLGKKVKIVEGVGHFMHREDPQLIQRYVVDFLRTVQPGC